MSDVLARRDRALSPEETEELLRDRLGDGLQRTVLEYGVFTVWVEQDAWVQAATLCRDEPLLAYDMFDNLFGIDAREEGFDVVAVLYSTSTGNRIALRTRCAGGRDEPTCPSITDIYRGADWMERETWDMFGVDFPGHPQIGPRILTVENFEGWPLRKDFHLASRAAKPWPGVKEPAELDEDGNVIERVPHIGDAPGPYDLDKAMAEQAQAMNPRPELDGPEDDDDADDEPAEVEAGPDDDPTVSGAEKAEARRKAQAEARAKKAAERAGGDGDEGAAQLDQDVYDQLIAEGKSERIARSKAKAAYIKAQRAKEGDA
ncbi:MAG: NADH-quinone oxidoreductase subunit C [Nitriliruptoraceae bacterium]|nr:NADH-quinone oxidoreductase subunit C [Nitriliruptoraceae bacterium]